MLFRALSSFVSVIVFTVRHQIEGERPPRDHFTFDVDCADHGRTFLHRNRTACCAGHQWVPSGRVKSRAVAGPATEVIFDMK